MNEIINRVANSALVTINLEDFYPKGQRVEIDLAQWLYEGLILREKDFRESLQNHNWSQYAGTYVSLHCSADAILPGWAFLLVTTYVQPHALRVVVGSRDDMNTMLFHEIISEMDIEQYRNKMVIVKGCSSKPVPESAFIYLAERLLPVVKSFMFGEACSTVPLFKRKK